MFETATHTRGSMMRRKMAEMLTSEISRHTRYTRHTHNTINKKKTRFRRARPVRDEELRKRPIKNSNRKITFTKSRENMCNDSQKAKKWNKKWIIKSTQWKKTCENCIHSSLSQLRMTNRTRKRSLFLSPIDEINNIVLVLDTKTDGTFYLLKDLCVCVVTTKATDRATL